MSIAAFRAGFVHKLVSLPILTPLLTGRCISKETYDDYKRGYEFATELFPEVA